jgi:hypothetical protein
MDSSALVPIFVVLFIIFLICREVVVWYFKINQIIQLLKSIDASLSIANKLPVEQIQAPSPLLKK